MSHFDPCLARWPGGKEGGGGLGRSGPLQHLFLLRIFSPGLLAGGARSEYGDHDYKEKTNTTMKIERGA